MMKRLTTTITAALAALYTLAGTALALPGEGYGVDPYGIKIPEGLPAADPVVQTATSTGMSLSPLLFVAVIVVTATVVAFVGYRAGAIHQRRLALR